MTAATAPALPADLTAGLRGLKLAAMRQLAPDLLLTAKTQRWAPEEILRTPDRSRDSFQRGVQPPDPNAQRRVPGRKTLDELDWTACSIPGPTLDYLASLEWITAKREPARVLDSTPLLDPVATQDTVTQSRAAVRKALAALDQAGSPPPAGCFSWSGSITFCSASAARSCACFASLSASWLASAAISFAADAA